MLSEHGARKTEQGLPFQEYTYFYKAIQAIFAPSLQVRCARRHGTVASKDKELLEKV
jgi:hypothetical protein